MRPPHAAASGGLPPPTVNARQETLIVYLAFAASLFFSLFASVIGVVYAYVRRNDVQETVYYSHLNYLIRLFWWQLALSCVPLLMVAYGVIWPLLWSMPVHLGWFFAAMVWGVLMAVWFLVRLVLGLIRYQDGRPIKVPLI